MEPNDAPQHSRFPWPRIRPHPRRRHPGDPRGRSPVRLCLAHSPVAHPFRGPAAGAKRRRRSAQHERTWFNLVGFTLRPGFGDPLDGWRMQQMWELFGPGIAHSDDSQQWSEWWTLWRRTAGGLDAEQQQMVYDVIAYYLQPPGGTDIPAPDGPRMQRPTNSCAWRPRSNASSRPTRHSSAAGCCSG
ncbi:hypothetical protein [Paracidovorax cattleyae]|uniref:hypothetical protein n=1 Tax=Paracidovorax cattleyae TaxID=80868 RepID=UPI0022A92A50|nr:hypothetical protein [Paracidovorax cattleyae]